MPKKIYSAAIEEFTLTAKTQRCSGDFQAKVEDQILSWHMTNVQPKEVDMLVLTKLKSPVLRATYSPNVQVNTQMLGLNDTAKLKVEPEEVEIPDDFIGWDQGSHIDPRDYFYISQDLGDLHLAIGVPTYIQFVIEVTGNGKYRFGDDHNIVVEVDAGDAFESVVTAFKASPSFQIWEKWVGVSIFGKIKNLPSLKEKKLRVSVHYDFGIMKDGDTLHMAWHSLWTQYKSTLLQTLNIGNTYEEQTFANSIRSVRLRGHSENHCQSSGSEARKRGDLV